MKRHLALCATALALALSACEPPGTSTAPDAGPGAADAGSADAADACGLPGVRCITALALTPSSARLKIGESVAFGAQAAWSDGSQSEVTDSVAFRSSDVAVARPSTTTRGLVAAVAPGTASVTASTAEDGTGVASLPAPVIVESARGRETRAVWVTRFAFTGLDATSGTAKIRRIVSDAADNGFNAVFLQIRGAGDAYYRSSLVPWWQSGSRPLGADPGWDPLQVGIDAAHARGIELHAYFNAFSGWPKSGGTTPQTPPASAGGAAEHILRAHPEYAAVDANRVDSAAEYTYLSPGNPAVRQHLADVAAELLTAYDVDGVHLDRIRYPGSSFSHDDASEAAYAAQYGTDRSKWADWQRENVNAAVEAIYRKMVATRPKATLTAAVWGIYRRLPGCTTSEGWSQYYQDSWEWMRRGIIDALCPMIYWDIGTGCTDWAKLLDGFIANANGRHVVAGMHVVESDGYPHFDRIQARIDHARKVGATGQVVFASAYIDGGTFGGRTWPAFWDQFGGGPYAVALDPAVVTWR